MTTSGGGYAEALQKLREALPAAQREQLDAEIGESLRKRWKHLTEMEQMVQALAVLHRPGDAGREAFCAECGNVLPCQTRKFINPYLAAS